MRSKRRWRGEGCGRAPKAACGESRVFQLIVCARATVAHSPPCSSSSRSRHAAFAARYDDKIIPEKHHTYSFRLFSLVHIQLHDIACQRRFLPCARALLRLVLLTLTFRPTTSLAHPLAVAQNHVLSALGSGAEEGPEEVRTWEPEHRRARWGGTTRGS